MDTVIIIVIVANSIIITIFLMFFIYSTITSLLTADASYSSSCPHFCVSRSHD